MIKTGLHINERFLRAFTGKYYGLPQINEFKINLEGDRKVKNLGTLSTGQSIDTIDFVDIMEPLVEKTKDKYYLKRNLNSILVPTIKKIRAFFLFFVTYKSFL